MTCGAHEEDWDAVREEGMEEEDLSDSLGRGNDQSVGLGVDWDVELLNNLLLM